MEHLSLWSVQLLHTHIVAFFLNFFDLLIAFSEEYHACEAYVSSSSSSSSSSRAFVLVAQGVSPCQFFVL